MLLGTPGALTTADSRPTDHFGTVCARVSICRRTALQNFSEETFYTAAFLAHQVVKSTAIALYYSLSRLSYGDVDEDSRSECEGLMHRQERLGLDINEIQYATPEELQEPRSLPSSSEILPDATFWETATLPTSNASRRGETQDTKEHGSSTTVDQWPDAQPADRTSLQSAETPSQPSYTTSPSDVNTTNSHDSSAARSQYSIHVTSCGSQLQSLRTRLTELRQSLQYKRCEYHQQAYHCRLLRKAPLNIFLNSIETVQAHEAGTVSPSVWDLHDLNQSAIRATNRLEKHEHRLLAMRKSVTQIEEQYTAVEVELFDLLMFSVPLHQSLERANERIGATASRHSNVFDEGNVATDGESLQQRGKSQLEEDYLVRTTSSSAMGSDASSVGLLFGEGASVPSEEYESEDEGTESLISFYASKTVERVDRWMFGVMLSLSTERLTLQQFLFPDHLPLPNGADQWIDTASAFWKSAYPPSIDQAIRDWKPDSSSEVTDSFHRSFSSSSEHEKSQMEDRSIEQIEPSNHLDQVRHFASEISDQQLPLDPESVPHPSSLSDGIGALSTSSLYSSAISRNLSTTSFARSNLSRNLSMTSFNPSILSGDLPLGTIFQRMGDLINESGRKADVWTATVDGSRFIVYKEKLPPDPNLST